MLSSPNDTPLSREDVLQIYSTIIEGQPGQLARGDECVESILGGALTYALYATPGDEIDGLRYAVGLVRGAATWHCFSDGNKRLALEMMTTVLWEWMGMTIDCTQEEAAQFVKDLTCKTGNPRLSIDEAVEWVADRLVADVEGPEAA